MPPLFIIVSHVVYAALFYVVKIPSPVKASSIAENCLPAILQRLNMNARHCVYLTKNFEQPFKALVGAAHHGRKAYEDMGKRWIHGLGQCEKYFSSS